MSRRPIKNLFLERASVGVQLRRATRDAKADARRVEGDDAGLPVEDLLRSVLAVAVPMWIERMRLVSVEERARIAEASADVIAERGDVLQFGEWKRRSGKKRSFLVPGATKEAFNGLARGLACMAFAPGGVEFLGERWEAR